MATIFQSLRLIKPRYKFRFFLLTFSRTIFGFVDLAGIALIGLIGVLAVSPKSTTKNFELLGISGTFSNSPSEIGYLVLITFVVFVFKAAVSLLLNRETFRLTANIDTDMALRMSNAIFRGPYSALRTIKKSKVQWILLEGVKQAFSVSMAAFSSLIVDFFSLIIIFVFLFAVDPIACIVTSLYFGLLLLFVQTVLGTLQKRVGQRQIDYSQRAWTAIEDAYVAYKENFVQKLVGRSIAHFGKPYKGMAIEIGKGAFLGSLPKVISELALMTGVLAFVSWQLFSGSLEESVGVIAVFLASGVKIMGVLGPIQSSLGTLRISGVQGEAAVRQISEFEKNNQTRTHMGIASQNVRKEIGNKGFKVEVNEAVFNFPDNKTPTIAGVDFTVKSGQFVAIIGPSGSGKTTLVDLILGLFQPESGSVYVEDSEVSELIQILPGSIAYVPQKPGLITGTLKQNITLNQPEELFDEKAFSTAIHKSQLTELVESLPYGIDQEIDGSNANLSGGQIQRIGLARALYSKPKLLVLDEATSALDAETEHAINQAIQDLRPDVTLIVIAHRLSTVQHADKVFVLEDGVITASGTFQKLRDTHSLVKEYVKLMSL